jgi:cbb3-type cytochrome oxidase maturation protein
MPLALAGIAIVLAGVIGAAVLWSVAEGRHDDTIADFARAPAGCDTTLTFEREGRFVIYVETAGHVDAIDGDCDVAGAFVRSDEVNPAFEVVVVDADGERIAIDGHSGVAYDSDGYVGASIGSLEIDGPDRSRRRRSGAAARRHQRADRRSRGRRHGTRARGTPATRARIGVGRVVEWIAGGRDRNVAGDDRSAHRAATNGRTAGCRRGAPSAVAAGQARGAAAMGATGPPRSMRRCRTVGQ